MAGLGTRRRFTCRVVGDAEWLEHLLSGKATVEVVISGHPLYESAFKYGPRVLPSHIMWLVTGGVCEFAVGRETVRLEPTSLVWVMPGVEHVVSAADEMLPTEAYNVNFRLTVGGHELRLAEDVMHLREAAGFRSHAALAVREINRPSAYYSQSVRSVLAAWCGGVLDAVRNPDLDRHVFNHSQRSRMVQWVRRRIAERVTSADLAAAFGLTQDYFSRVFRKTYGMPPREWITRERVRMGAALLEQSRLNVSQVAQRLGYQGVHLFCRQFTREYGCSPTEYRRNR